MVFSGRTTKDEIPPVLLLIGSILNTVKKNTLQSRNIYLCFLSAMDILSDDLSFMMKKNNKDNKQMVQMRNELFKFCTFKERNPYFICRTGLNNKVPIFRIMYRPFHDLLPFFQCTYTPKTNYETKSKIEHKKMKKDLIYCEKNKLYCNKLKSSGFSSENPRGYSAMTLIPLTEVWRPKHRQTNPDFS